MRVERSLLFLLSTAAAVLLPLPPAAPAAGPPDPPATRPTFQVGTIRDARLPELSGLASSRKVPGLFWAHNDGGNPAELFAIHPDGKVEARIAVEGAANVDWEDIAADDRGRLYLADIGNNNGARRELAVYRLDEPDLNAAGPVRPTARWVLRYPAGPAFDCEAFFVHEGFGYLIPKLRSFQPPVLHRFPLAETDRPVTLEAIGPIAAVRGPVTAATLSADARHLAVLTVLGPQVFAIDGDPVRLTRTPPAGQATFVSPRMEAAAFVAEGLLTGNEEGQLFLFSWSMLGMKPPAAEVKAP